MVDCTPPSLLYILLVCVGFFSSVIHAEREFLRKLEQLFYLKCAFELFHHPVGTFPWWGFPDPGLVWMQWRQTEKATFLILRHESGAFNPFQWGVYLHKGLICLHRNSSLLQYHGWSGRANGLGACNCDLASMITYLCVHPSWGPSSRPEAFPRDAYTHACNDSTSILCHP